MVVQSFGTFHILKDTVLVGIMNFAINGLCVSKSSDFTTSPDVK